MCFCSRGVSGCESKNQLFVGQIFFLQISLFWRDVVVLNINLGICRYLFFLLTEEVLVIFSCWINVETYIVLTINQLFYGKLVKVTVIGTY